ncbi:MAG: hypothetical protein AB1566_12645 [Chloroflexota bacterium]|jgi:hypothetical protein
MRNETVVAVVTLIVLAAIVFAVVQIYPTIGLSGLRDIAIIILVLESFIVTLLLAIVVVLLWQLIDMLKKEIKPVLASARQTADTVKGTTTFVSDGLVAPLIRVYSLSSGVLGTFRGLIRKMVRKGGKSHVR